jgi:hypothetical protein
MSLSYDYEKFKKESKNNTKLYNWDEITELVLK